MGGDRRRHGAYRQNHWVRGWGCPRCRLPFIVGLSHGCTMAQKFTNPDKRCAALPQASPGSSRASRAVPYIYNPPYLAASFAGPIGAFLRAKRDPKIIACLFHGRQGLCPIRRSCCNHEVVNMVAHVGGARKAERRPTSRCPSAPAMISKK